MKNLIIAAVAVAVLSFAGNIFAGDISQDMLSDMGLGNMQTMSDTQGLEVRGIGYFGSACQGLSVGIRLGLRTG